jgi:hypothetical protein
MVLVKKGFPAEEERSKKRQENHFFLILKIIDFGLFCAARELKKEYLAREKEEIFKS